MKIMKLLLTAIEQDAVFSALHDYLGKAALTEVAFLSSWQYQLPPQVFKLQDFLDTAPQIHPHFVGIQSEKALLAEESE